MIKIYFILQITWMITEPVIHFKTSCFQVKRHKGEAISAHTHYVKQLLLVFSKCIFAPDSTPPFSTSYICTSVEYSRKREKEIEGEIEQLNERIKEGNAKSENTRKKLIEHIGYDAAYSQKIEEVVEALECRKKEYRDAMIDALSNIIAGHMVSDSVEEFRKQEDEQIENYLNDESIAILIEKFTQNYNKVYLYGEEIHIGTESQAFNIKEMSTGVQEQILLALRMGIARKLSGKDSLFLLLDDAFQYSDWDRRQILVDQAVEAIGSGWQVIYFTMDDDIRDRFKRVAKRLIPNDFKLIEL
ncbi:hypothetical protein ES703_83270 [subsurface metagenome]